VPTLNKTLKENFMRASAIAVATAAFLSLAAAGPAMAGKGHITDPSGELPDILRLDYNNAKSKITMKMKVASAQNQSFYMLGGKKSYQVFYSPSRSSKPELRYQSKNAATKQVTCTSLKLTELPTQRSTQVVIPRTCIAKAPDQLQFQGIATSGLSLFDETKLSPKVKRG